MFLSMPIGSGGFFVDKGSFLFAGIFFLTLSEKKFNVTVAVAVVYLSSSSSS